MATSRKSSKPVGIPGRDDDFGVFMDQYYANKKAKASGSSSKSSGKKTTTKK